MNNAIKVATSNKSTIQPFQQISFDGDDASCSQRFTSLTATTLDLTTLQITANFRNFNVW